MSALRQKQTYAVHKPVTALGTHSCNAAKVRYSITSSADAQALIWAEQQVLLASSCRAQVPGRRRDLCSCREDSRDARRLAHRSGRFRPVKPAPNLPLQKTRETRELALHSHCMVQPSVQKTKSGRHAASSYDTVRAVQLVLTLDDTSLSVGKPT